MAKYILYSNTIKTNYAVSNTYTMTNKPMCVGFTSTNIWYGGNTEQFGKINRTTGAITPYSVPAGNDIRGLEVNEAQNILFLFLLSGATHTIQARSLTNPTVVLASYAGGVSGYSGGYDPVNKKLYVALGTDGVKVFNWDSVGNTITLNTTLATTPFFAYEVKAFGSLLFVSSNTNGTLKTYQITNGTPNTFSFIKDITATRAQIRGLTYNPIDKTLFLSHGTTSDSFGIYDYTTGTLLNEVFPAGGSQPFGIALATDGSVAVASYGNSKVLKAV